MTYEIFGYFFIEKVSFADFVGDLEGWLRNSYKNFHY